MDVQKDILKELIFGHFPGSLARILYPRRKPEDITYVEAAYKVKEPNLILPNDKRGSFEHDVILLFQHVIKNGPKGLFNVVRSLRCIAPELPFPRRGFSSSPRRGSSFRR